MSHTNSTANLGLPQFIGTDKPTWLSDVNAAFAAIDAYAGTNDAALAITDGKAATAISDASNAVTTATNAATTAGNAAATATNANTVAGNALTIVNNTAAKMGDLTQLVTTDKSSLVAAVNEVAGSISAPAAEDVTYDNAGSGLAATDVQAAIDELAQGGGIGAWTQLGQQTGVVSVALDLTGLSEILVSIEETGKMYLNTVIPAAALSNTAMNYVGGYSSGASTGVAAADITNTSAIITSVKTDSVDKSTTAVITVYGR